MRITIEELAKKYDQVITETEELDEKITEYVKSNSHTESNKELLKNEFVRILDYATKCSDEAGKKFPVDVVAIMTELDKVSEELKKLEERMKILKD